MKTVRAGVIGTGWGQLQLEALQRVKGVQVTALCDVDAARLETLANQYKVPNTFGDYRDLIASAQVDWVAIATPPDQHKPMVLAAIEAGKHVFCEKPVALTAREASELLDAANARGIVHVVDYEMRYLPAHAYSKELIDEDYLGQLLRAEVTMTMEHPWGEHGNWAAELALGGGVLMELGMHFIDMLRWWFGDVSRVFAGTRTHFPTVRVPGAKEKGNGNSIRKVVTGDDAFWCILQFARGGEALVSFMTGARHDPGWSIAAYGQTGSLIIKSGQLWAMRDGDREIGLMPIPKRLELANTPADPLMWGMSRLIEHAAAKINGAPDAVAVPDFRDGVLNAQIVEAIRRASDEHRWVNVE